MSAPYRPAAVPNLTDINPVVMRRLTDAECQILRAYSGGHTVAEIAKARKTDAVALHRQLEKLCGLSRFMAKGLAEAGVIAEPHPALLAIQPALPPEPVSRQPIASWSAWMCRDCTHIGPAGEHAGCNGQLDPVTVAIHPGDVS